jgi:hypothetical protein
MMIQAIAIALTVRFVVWLLIVEYAGPTLRHNATVTMGVMLILLTALLLQGAVAPLTRTRAEKRGKVPNGLMTE